MASKATDELLDEIEQKLQAHGVQNYVISLSDPDEQMDIIRGFGSMFWRIGAATDIIDDIRFDRKLDRLHTEEEDPE